MFFIVTMSLAPDSENKDTECVISHIGVVPNYLNCLYFQPAN